MYIYISAFSVLYNLYSVLSFLNHIFSIGLMSSSLRFSSSLSSSSVLLSFGSIRFNIIPTSVANATPAISTSDPANLNFTAAPPIPNTIITEDIIKFLFLLKSILSSTNTLKPEEAIIPNKVYLLLPLLALV